MTKKKDQEVQEQEQAEQTPKKKDSNLIEIETEQGDFSFTRDKKHYSEYINSVAKGKVSQGSRNFCILCVVDKDRDQLKDLFKQNPGACLEIAAAMGAEIAPEIEAQVKK